MRLGDDVCAAIEDAGEKDYEARLRVAATAYVRFASRDGPRRAHVRHQERRPANRTARVSDAPVHRRQQPDQPRPIGQRALAGRPRTPPPAPRRHPARHRRAHHLWQGPRQPGRQTHRRHRRRGSHATVSNPLPSAQLAQPPRSGSGADVTAQPSTGELVWSTASSRPLARLWPTTS